MTLQMHSCNDRPISQWHFIRDFKGSINSMLPHSCLNSFATLFRPRHLRLAALATWITCQFICTAKSDQFDFDHENVLGTSLELRVDCDSLETARQCEQLALAEIDRLSGIFSTYDATSQLAKFNKLAVGESMTVSPELLVLLKRCEAWQATSDGAFNPAVETLTSRWKLAAREGKVPADDELAQIVKRLKAKHWSVDMASHTLTRLSAEALTLNAIAKGTILDAAADKMRSRYTAEQLRGATINIGGDIRVVSQMYQVVSIPHPSHDAIGGKLISQVTLSDSAIATSGTSERSLKVADKSYSHIFSPSTGLPCNDILSASVIAENAETADILATICCVLPTPQAIRLVDSLPSAKCMIFTLSGAIVYSENWPSGPQEGTKPEGTQEKTPSTDDKTASTTKAAATPHEFQLEFEIAKSTEGGRYRRPYVAAWVEDKDGFPVKTLSLFLMENNPGPRWHRDLRRWHASDQVRLLVDSSKLIGTVSKPTRNPGVYKVAWDGTDDHGKAIADGEYTLYIEAAREHGTYQLMKHPFSLGKKDFDEKLKGNVEIKEASFRYTKKP